MAQSVLNPHMDICDRCGAEFEPNDGLHNYGKAWFPAYTDICLGCVEELQAGSCAVCGDAFPNEVLDHQYRCPAHVAVEYAPSLGFNLEG